MSVMRFYAIAIVAACLVAAQTPRQGCPALSGTSALFTNTSSTCTQATSCTTDYTTCLAKNTTSCDNAKECIGARFSCLFKAAENTTGCRQLNNVQLSLLKVSSGSQRFNASDAGMSCAASACRWLNETLVGGRGTNCTLDYDVLCQSPIVAVATIVFRGNFSGILADPVKRTAFSNAIRNDFARALRLVVSQIRIKRLFLVGSRRQASQTLVVEIEILGVSASNSDFATTLAAIKANPSSFFSETTASYSALNPGQTLQITGVGVGSASNAFSQGIPTGVATPAPVRSNTTAAPRSNATTTAAPRGSTAAPRTTTTTSGSSLASAILGVVSAAVIALAL